MSRAATLGALVFALACGGTAPANDVVVRVRVVDDLDPVVATAVEDPGEPMCDVEGPDGLAVLDVAVGYGHACAVLSDGRVRCWGENYNGQLGDGTRGRNATPSPVRDVEGASAVGAGRMHACALGGGRVFCWGSNDHGQLGAGSRGSGVGPTAQEARVRAAAQLAVGWDHACALTERGQVQCWGRNHLGQLGDGTRELRAAPTPVRALHATAIGAGVDTTCAVAVDGRVACWGGLAMSERPRYVDGLPAPAVSVDVGEATACARLVDGSVWCWGDGMHGLLGAVRGASEAPMRVEGLPPATSLRVSGTRACVIGGQSELWCWGANEPGIEQAASPRTIGHIGAIEGAAVGREAICARLSRGGLCCWGSNQSGLLGALLHPFRSPPEHAELPAPMTW